MCDREYTVVGTYPDGGSFVEHVVAATPIAAAVAAFKQRRQDDGEAYAAYEYVLVGVFVGTLYDQAATFPPDWDAPLYCEEEVENS